MTVLFTPRFNFPFPDEDEDADVPFDIGELAQAVEDTLANVYDVLVPIGSMKIWPQAIAPSDWLLCQGQSLERAGTYADLFTILGTAFGSVDGTHFNLPDLRGRVPVGVDGTAGRLNANDALGETGGSQEHTISVNELPRSVPTNEAYETLDSAPQRNVTVSDGSGNVVPRTDTATASWDSGINAPHNIMQPYQIINFVIRYA